LRRHTFLQQESARSLKEIREISSRDPEKTPWNGITPYPEHVALDQLESHGRRSLAGDKFNSCRQVGRKLEATEDNFT
jgi:hypothetical protein